MWLPLDIPGERIARFELAGVEAAPKPLHPLRGRAVRERLRVDATPGHLLEAVVADLAGGVERLVEVADLEQVAAIRRLRPYAGEAIGLQLLPHRRGVARAAARELL